MKIQLEDLTKSFPGRGRNSSRVTAVKDFNFEIPDGELIGLLGPSGCGKSTTLNMICGLEKPTSGKIFFGDKDVTALPPEKRGVGMVFQNYALYPHMTVRENITYALRVHKLDQQELNRRLQTVLEILGLEPYIERKPRELSGGMKKRAAIARVLAVDPAILMMDEPFAPLDAFTRQRLQDDILSLWENTGCTILYVTHDLTEAITLADRVVLMSARPGRVVREYPIDLPRPRRVMDVKFSPRFVDLERAIWQELEAQLPQEEGRR